MGFLELLFLVLLVGKLAGWFVISWGWVIAPLIPAVIIWAILLVVFGGAAVLAIFNKED